MKNELRENGRIILAHGESTGHVHEVVERDTEQPPAPSEAGYFHDPEHGRVLMITGPCVLRHEEHGAIALAPDRQEQYRQGDVLLQPIGAGVWRVIGQTERLPEGLRYVAD